MLFQDGFAAPEDEVGADLEAGGDVGGDVGGEQDEY